MNCHAAIGCIYVCGWIIVLTKPMNFDRVYFAQYHYYFRLTFGGSYWIIGDVHQFDHRAEILCLNGFIEFTKNRKLTWFEARYQCQKCLWGCKMMIQRKYFVCAIQFAWMMYPPSQKIWYGIYKSLSWNWFIKSKSLYIPLEYVCDFHLSLASSSHMSRRKSFINFDVNKI